MSDESRVRFPVTEVLFCCSAYSVRLSGGAWRSKVCFCSCGGLANQEIINADFIKQDIVLTKPLPQRYAIFNDIFYMLQRVTLYLERFLVTTCSLLLQDIQCTGRLFFNWPGYSVVQGPSKLPDAEEESNEELADVGGAHRGPITSMWHAMKTSWATT